MLRRRRRSHNSPLWYQGPSRLFDASQIFKQWAPLSSEDGGRNLLLVSFSHDDGAFFISRSPKIIRVLFQFT